ncbi:MAG: gfo/Idh/MocA family oxidoreductase [Paenibacillus sp.]|jgi:predicted dehydrogenase|nr:gfo/Idh/MocA family oxidoreductase [Paenibacillus sp.]
MYRAAVIGLGYIGLRADIPRKVMTLSHTLAYQMNPAIDLVAAVGKTREQGEQLALVAPRTSYFTDLRAMLSRHQLDMISICTPEHVRFELLQTVLEHSSVPLLFLEKPVATSVEEAEKIADLIKRHKRTVVVNLSRRWSEGANQIRQAVQSEEFGKLKKIHLRYTRGIYNYGSHLFDLVRFVVGSIDQVQVVHQVATNRDAKKDWTYSFLFTLAGGGITGYAEAFDDRDILMFEMDLFFEKGKIEMLRTGDEIRFYSTGKNAVIQGNHWLLQRTEGDLLSRSSLIEKAVDHLVHILRDGTEPLSSLEDGIYPLYVAEALLQSHKNYGSLETVMVHGSQ